MEMKIEEIEETNYWDNQKETKTEKKKKVSFDDILCNMNLVVNKQGVLQFMQPNTQSQHQPFIDSQQKQVEKVEKVEDNNVNHSYIYNKYFKDYTKLTSQNTPEIRRPKTIEEYKQMLIDDRNKAIEQAKRIEQIKSKKMLYTTGPQLMRPTIMPSQNNLKSMRFY
jgi:hypothetical protein